MITITRNKNIRGFTLIEMMIVLVVISIVLAYAIPSYRNYVLRSKRTEAHNALVNIASLQERFYANNNRYGTSAELGLAASYPAPTAANDLNYTISMANTNTSYTITAVAAAVNGQNQDVAACLTYTINNIGTRTPANQDCW